LLSPTEDPPRDPTLPPELDGGDSGSAFDAPPERTDPGSGRLSRLVRPLGVRGRLVGISLVLIMGGGLVAGLYLESTLRGFFEERAEAELERHAATFRESLRLLADGSAETKDPHAVATALGKGSNIRLTLIRADGVVVADSALKRTELAGLDNHRERPEVNGALHEGRGVSARVSSTTGVHGLYVALPYLPSDQAKPTAFAVVRASMPLAEVDALVARLRVALGAAGLVLLLATLFMSSLASHLFTRTLRVLVVRARSLAEHRPSLDVERGDELQYLAGSFTRMAEELRRALRALAKERDRFEATLDGMSEAVLAINRHQRVRLANPACLELLGLDRPPIDRPLSELFEEQSLLDLVSDRDTSDDAIRTVEFETKESRRRVLARLTPLSVSRGAVLVLHDVTEMRHLERVRQDFIANVSHELRTPVSVIRANAEALRSGAIDDKERAAHFLEALERNADRVGRLVADLLDLSRIESGRFVPKFEDVPVADVIGGAADSISVKIEERGHHVRLRLDDGVRVHADRGALEQILVNLLENATKYTPQGGSIEIHARRQGHGRVRIEVHDNGPGIGPEHRARLFERFYRVDTGRSKEMGGTGLGLSIVKHLVHAMDGTVGMDPLEPQGSNFWVELQAATEDVDASTT
jgi:two-component system phosphate regulon sensor histidine kinase PhoR